MADVNWALGLQQGNAGDAFNQAYQQGQQQRQANMAKAAMAALVQNPNNTRALQALAKVDPQSAMTFWKEQTAQHHDNIIKGAQILRQFNPSDQSSYTQALAAAQAAGIDISQVPQQYNPEYVRGVIQTADALKPEAQDPSPIREYDEATKRGLLPQGTSYQQFLQLKNPGMNSPVVLPQSYSMVSGGAPGGGSVPQVHDQASYDAIPAGAQYQTPDGHIRVKGGSTAPAPSGGFPGPY